MENSTESYVYKKYAEISSEIYSIRWSSDDSFIACARGDGTISLHDGELMYFFSLDCKLRDPLPISSIRWKPERGLTKNILLACTSEGAIIEWHTTSKKHIFSYTLEENHALCCDYNPEQEFFAIGCKDETIKIFDDSTKSISLDLHRMYHHIGHGNRVYAVKWSDPNTLFSAGWDNNILIWDIRTGQVVKFFNGAFVTGDSIDVHGDTLVCADCSMNNQIKVWSVSQETLIYTQALVENGKPFKGYTAQFEKKHSSLTFLGGTGHAQGYFFSFPDFTEVARINDVNSPIYDCDFSNHGRKIAVGTADGVARIFDTQRFNKA